MRYEQFYLGGRFEACTGAAALPVCNPSTEAITAHVQSCSAQDLDRAIQCAADALPQWSRSTLDERRAALQKLAAALQQRSSDVVDSLAREMGCPVWLGEMMQLPMAMKGLEFARDALDQVVWQERVGNGLVERIPVGVIAAITPWNFPVHQIVAKVAAAIAAGCTVVLKPSELAPGAAWAFIQACHDAGLPPGVVNLVWGDANIGRQLVIHPQVDQISFTGSTAVGRAVSVDAANAFKRVTLELGGKSAAVLLPDADLDKAIPVALRMAVANSGQACVSQSRLIVPRESLGQIEERLTGLLGDWSIGDPLDPATRLGPVANQRQFIRINRLVEQALDQGARRVAGGTGRAAGFTKGWFCPVTILSDIDPDFTIAQEEVFGPVLAVMPYDSESQALTFANATRYGLSGAVWSSDQDRATRFAREMITGQVIINGAPQNLATPFGGRRDSGLGRENGRFGVEECLTYRSLHGA
ncbi:aldehyde dehydrogenase family protein [Bordetella tumbae]